MGWALPSKTGGRAPRVPLKLGSLPDSLLPMKEDKDDPASLHSAGLYSVVCNGFWWLPNLLRTKGSNPQTSNPNRPRAAWFISPVGSYLTNQGIVCLRLHFKVRGEVRKPCICIMLRGQSPLNACPERGGGELRHPARAFLSPPTATTFREQPRIEGSQT